MLIGLPDSANVDALCEKDSQGRYKHVSMWDLESRWKDVGHKLNADPIVMVDHERRAYSIALSQREGDDEIREAVEQLISERNNDEKQDAEKAAS